MQRIFVISGPSGSGKGAILQPLKKMDNFKFTVSCTTRPKRSRETDGIEYYFLSNDEFDDGIKQEEFLEWEATYDYKYGTKKSEVENILKSGKNCVLEIDVRGALNIKKIYPDAVLIFIVPPSFEILKERLIRRGTETEKTLRKRLERYKKEILFKDKYDYIVINDDLTTAQQNLLDIIKKES